MLGLAVQSFLSAATGIVAVIALIRGSARRSAKSIGNAWVDLTRVTLWILLPICFVHGLLLPLRASRTSAPGWLYIDLDHFKPVNDMHGHPVGDELLKQFALRLKAAVRPTDGVARLGGGEFAVVMPNVRDDASAQVVARNVIAAAVPFQIGALAVRVGATVGIALSGGSSSNGDDLVARADATLYRAKSMGRGRFAA